MKDYRILLSSTFHTNFANLPYHLCADVHHRASRGLDYFQHFCPAGARGRHVTFVKDNARGEALVLCEVEVYGADLPNMELRKYSRPHVSRQRVTRHFA